MRVKRLPLCCPSKLHPSPPPPTRNKQTCRLAHKPLLTKKEMEEAAVVQHHQQLLEKESLSSPPTRAEAVATWKRYVADEVESMLRVGVSPAFNKSWMLRKGVRAHLPRETLRRLYEVGPQTPEWVDQRAEALRYAMIDDRLDEPLQELFNRSPSQVVTKESCLIVVVFAVMARQWDVAMAYTSQLLTMGDADGFGRAIVIADAMGLPEDKRTDYFRAALRSVDPEIAAAMRDEVVTKTMRHVKETDDSDNYYPLDGYNIAGAGHVVADEQVIAAPLMSTWLAGLDDGGDSYLARLREVLVRRFSDFRVIGAGAFGVVLSATRNGQRYAIKLTRLVDPLGVTSDEHLKTIKDELPINLAIAASPVVRAALPYLPYVVDWTRGRMDVVKLLRTLTGQQADSGNRLLVAGAGIYMVQVMPAFDFTLDAWMSSVRVAAGANAEAFAAFVRMLMPIFTVLLVQLFVLRVAFPGFRHTDIKADNVLLYRLKQPGEMTTPIVSVRFEALWPAAQPSGQVTVLPAHTGMYAPSMNDFGLVAIDGPHAMGRVNQDHNDLKRMALMVPVGWPDASGTLKALAKLLWDATDTGSPQDIVALFRAKQHTGTWMTNYWSP